MVERVVRDRIAAGSVMEVCAEVDAWGPDAGICVVAATVAPVAEPETGQVVVGKRQISNDVCLFLLPG